MVWIAVALLSLLFGVILCLVIQYAIFKKWFHGLPIVGKPYKAQYEPFKLPRDILDLLRTASFKGKKETCISLNLLLQFLFAEMRDTKRVRRWVMKRMDIEFEELLQTTTTGKLLDSITVSLGLLDSITVRDFNLGAVFPILKDVRVHDAKLCPDNTLEEVCVEVDLDYSGGFQIAVDVDMVFGKCAYLSVKIAKLIGTARLKMTRTPYTHWTFSFVEEPVIEFEAESQFEGRPITQLTSLIIKQIRKSVRKKHTLPNYKFRYKPFFMKPETPKPSQDIYCLGSKISTGELSITVIHCSRLVSLPGDGDLFVYCSLALDKLPWAELLNSRRKLWRPHDFQIDKGQALNLGLTFSEEFIIDRSEEMIVVKIVTSNSPADKANIKKGDVLISVNGVKVTSSKQAARLMKQAPDSFNVQIERSSVKGPPTENMDFMYKEDSVTLTADQEEAHLADDYVNISVKQQTLPEGSHSLKHEASLQPDVSFAKSIPTNLNVAEDTSDVRRRRKGSLDAKSVPCEQEQTAKSKSTSVEEHADPKTFDNITSLLMETASNISHTITGSHIVKSASNISLSLYDNVTNLRPIKSDPDMVKTKIKSKDEGSSGLDLRKTKLVQASQNPVFREEFTFQVSDTDAFLNVCVWGKSPEKLDKQNRTIKPEKSILLGHISIPVMNIALECMLTNQGDFQQTYQLTPAEARAGASRSKYASLATHRGFDENLCHGDIALAFKHSSTQLLSKSDRKRISKTYRECTDDADDSQRVEEAKRPLQDGEHDFGLVKFTSATSCDFCHKKIWFKNGYTCNACKLICHKKCMERCQSATKCTKEGWVFRFPNAVVENAKKAALQVTQLPDHRSDSTNTPQKPSLLSRFRRGDKAPTPPPLTASSEAASSSKQRSFISLQQKKLKLLQLLERQRHSTASGSDSDHKSKEDNLMAANVGLQKTRSSPAIDELMKNRNQESESDSDDPELNLKQYYEQQKVTAQSDEMLVSQAKEMGKELFIKLPPQQRKIKLDQMINKLQRDIDITSEYRAEQSREVKSGLNQQHRAALEAKMVKTDEKIQSLAVLMLHYCAGLQHCMESIEAQKTSDSMLTRSESFESIKSESSLETEKRNFDSEQIMKPTTEEMARKNLEVAEGAMEGGCEPVAAESVKSAGVEFELQLNSAIEEMSDSEEEDEHQAVSRVVSDMESCFGAAAAATALGIHTPVSATSSTQITAPAGQTSLLQNFQADYFNGDHKNEIQRYGLEDNGLQPFTVNQSDSHQSVLKRSGDTLQDSISLQTDLNTANSKPNDTEVFTTNSSLQPVSDFTLLADSDNKEIEKIVNKLMGNMAEMETDDANLHQKSDEELNSNTLRNVEGPSHSPDEGNMDDVVNALMDSIAMESARSVSASTASEYTALQTSFQPCTSDDLTAATVNIDQSDIKKLDDVDTDDIDLNIGNAMLKKADHE